MKVLLDSIEIARLMHLLCIVGHETALGKMSVWKDGEQMDGVLGEKLEQLIRYKKQLKQN